MVNASCDIKTRRRRRTSTELVLVPVVTDGQIDVGHCEVVGRGTMVLVIWRELGPTRLFQA